MRGVILVIQLQSRTFSFHGFIRTAQFPEYITEVGLIICVRGLQRDSLAQITVCLLIMIEPYTSQGTRIQDCIVLRIRFELRCRVGLDLFSTYLGSAEALDMRAHQGGGRWRLRI